MFLRKRFTAYVVFEGSDHAGIWSPILKPGFRHCYVLLPFWYPEPSITGFEWTLKIEQTGWGIDYEIFYHPLDEVAEAALNHGSKCVVKFPVAIDAKPGYFLRGLGNCVTVIKSLLALRAWWVITPYQLHQWLLHNGGEDFINGESVQ